MCNLSQGIKEEEPDTIQRIYETAKDFAPDYNVEQIYKAMKE